MDYKEMTRKLIQDACVEQGIESDELIWFDDECDEGSECCD